MKLTPANRPSLQQGKTTPTRPAPPSGKPATKPAPIGGCRSCRGNKK